MNKGESMSPEERQAWFMAALKSKPCIFVPDDENKPEGEGTGYWHADGHDGVISYRRGANGQYDRWSQVTYPNALIDTLNKARELE
jgi:hypothetical protein